MKQIATEKTFRILEDETFHFAINKTIYLTLIETDNNRYYIELSDDKKLIGRRLTIKGPTAHYIFKVFKNQLKRYTYHSEALLCLDLAFSRKTLRETTLVMRLYGYTFHHMTLGKIRDRFALELKWVFDDPEEEDKIFKFVSVGMFIPGKKNAFGYFRGHFRASDFRFYFYP